MKKLRLLFMLVTLLVALQQASATTSVDIANGAVTIDGTKKTYTQNDVTQGYDGVIVLTGTLESGATVVTISGGTEDAPVMIELDGLDAHATGDGCNGLCIKGGAYVNITVSGTNTVRSGKDAAGLRLEETSYLTIDAASTGSLSCYGGRKNEGAGGGAGIGANCGKGYGTLTINGGTIYAEGCQGGAGIGSGWEYSTGERTQGQLIINGGYVKARGSWGDYGNSCGEGIGSINNTPAQVVVTGGIVDATVHEGSSLTDGNGNTLVSKWFDGLTPGQEVKVKPFDDYEGTLAVGEDGALSVIVPESRENNDVFLGKKVIQTSVSDKNRGSITSGGIYDVGTQLTLNVTLLQHNSVTGWSDDENNKETTRTITVSEDAKYVANLADLRDPITYDVLSETDKTAYVSRFYYYMDYTDSDREKSVSVDIPETVEIEGETYTVVQFGMEEYDTDDFRFNYMATSYLTFPKTMKYVWLNPLRQVAGMYSGMQLTLTFKGENAPKLLPEGSSNIETHQIYVPYGAEDDYKSFAYMVKSRHTDLDIANGAITVNGNEYTQGDVTGTIDGTLVVTGTNGDDLTRKLTINGGTEDAPVRIAIKDLTIDLDASPDESGYMPINIEQGAWVDMIVQGTNTLKGGKDAAGIRVAGESEDGSEAVLNICQLSTGELNAYGGSTVNGDGGGAGIGANVGSSYGTIIINGGTIYAEGCKGGAGIGSGWEYEIGNRSQGQLIFNGGTVTAKGSSSNYGYSCLEGIGSVNGAAEVILAGGTVNATMRAGTDSKTGIDVSKGVVTIDGAAKTYTQNGETKSYDGKLWLTGKLTANETIVTINGGTEDEPVMVELDGLDVTATGGGEQQEGGCKNGISISSGAYVNMTISGENVTRGGHEATALRIPTGATLVIDESSTGSLSCYGTDGGAGIGSNINADYGTLTINGGTIYAEGTGGGAGIGNGWKYYPETNPQGLITINGGTVTAIGSSGWSAGTAHGHSCPDGIGSVNAPAEVIIAGGTVNASIRDGSVIKDGEGKIIEKRNFDGLTPGQIVDVSQYAPFGTTATVGENGVISVYVYEEATNDGIFFGKKIIKTYVDYPNRGSITGGGIYDDDETVTLKVTLFKHNSVTGWSDNENNTETTRTITVSKDAQYTVYLADLRDPITYDVLSEEDKTAYVSRFFYNSENTSEESMSIEIPETVEIGGETYTVVQFGMEEYDWENDFRFEPRNESSITFPKTMKYIWRNPFRWIAEMGILESLTFKSETVPEFLPEGETMFMHGKVYVPYGAEEAYGKIFREENVTSRHTDLNIADGAITVNGSEYTQGDVTGTIDETLVISGEVTSGGEPVRTSNNIVIAGGTEERPVRVALKNVFIYMRNTPNAVPVELADGAFVDMIIEGRNCLMPGESSAGLRVATTYGEDGTPLISTLNICQLSTGFLESLAASPNAISGGAGIGGNINENPGNIFINAGEVIAEGCKGGAGIGGGWIRAKDKNTRCGRIAIYGGSVNAWYYEDGDSEGISVGKPVGSANNYLLFYVSDDATFNGELKDNVVRTDADGNFSATATVYRGSVAGSEEKVSTTTVLEDNAVAFTKSKALADYMDNVVLHGDLYDDEVYEGRTCRNLNLVEGKPFYAPEDFTAENVQFTINTDEDFVYADGTNGWHTLCLPFSGTFYADDEPVVPFAGLDDMNGMFWLKTFSGASSGNVLGFDFTTTVEAGKPYIYAIPGDKWGSEHSMKGKTISVRATDVPVIMEPNDVKGSEYVFGGSFTGETKQGSVYVLNDDGNTFKWYANGECCPFNAVVTAPLDETGAKTTLVIGDVVPTGIRLPDGSIVGASQRDTHVYDVSGKRVGTMRPGNVYIKNNKKMLKR